MNTFNNKTLPMHFSQTQDQFPRNIYHYGNYDNENYRFVYNNPFSMQLSGNEPFKNSCFLGYLHANKSVSIGPILMNVSISTADSFGEPFSLEFYFIHQDQLLNEDPSKTFQVKEIQSKFESMLSDRNIFPTNKFEDFEEFMKAIYKSEKLKFQMIQLPFDTLKVNHGGKMNSHNPGSRSMIPTVQEMNDIAKDKYFNFMKQEIQLLKEQNQLLKHQLEFKSKVTNNKEYVLRKSSSITTKSSRHSSGQSFAVNNESRIPKSPLKQDKTENYMIKNPTDKDGSPVYEILQEYMLENEALRTQNNTLNEMRVKHHSELELIFKENQNLTEIIKELTRRISQICLKDSENLSPETLLQPKSSKRDHQIEIHNQSYPVMTEKYLSPNEKKSYLRQYDSLKHRSIDDNTKKGLPASSKDEKILSSTEKPITISSKSEKVQVTLNDSLREELGRIDNMIKEHIKKSQVDDGFRNMGGKNNFPKI